MVLIRAWIAVFVMLPTAIGWAAKKPVDRSQVRIAHIEHRKTAVAQRWALVAWAQEIRLRTSIEISQEPVRTSLHSNQLFRYPLLYWAGNKGFDKLPMAAIARLRRHLSTGGTLIVDDISRSGPSDAFDKAIRRTMRSAFGKPMERVPPSHVVHRSFYRLRTAVGRRNSVRHLEGIRLGNRYAVLYVRNDLHGAFSRSPTGGAALHVIPGGEPQREQAYRLGVNLVMYAMCLNYKDDHVHVTRLLQSRRGARPTPAPRRDNKGGKTAPQRGK